MPNWKEPADYDFTEHLDGSGWAWEFLRRNNNYAEDYDECERLVQREEEKHGPYPNPIYKFLGDKVKHTLYCDPPKKEKEEIQQWLGRCHAQNLYPHRYHPSIWYGKKWHLKQAIQSPLINKPPLFDSPIIRKAELISFDNVGKYIEDGGEPEDYIAIGFDLSAPIGPQWDAVKEIVQSKHKNYQKPIDHSPSVSKHTVANFKNYLRVLDAIAAGINLNDIAKVLIP